MRDEFGSINHIEVVVQATISGKPVTYRLKGRPRTPAKISLTPHYVEHRAIGSASLNGEALRLVSQILESVDVRFDLTVLDPDYVIEEQDPSDHASAQPPTLRILESAPATASASASASALQPPRPPGWD
jgi:hypothetical protein